MSTASINPRHFLRSLFDTAVQAVSAQQCLPAWLPQPPQNGRTLVIGAGKGAAAMAKVVETQWSGKVEGLVVTRYGHGANCQHIEVIEAAHPVPDEAGRAAAGRILQRVQGLTENDLVLCLISGGGSALLSAPAPGISLEQKQAINRALLKSGATIAEINCVRKHLSAIKGGKLALACAPARVITLLISDVPGDDPGVIASGPTLPDPTTCAQALAILHKYAIALPDNITQHLQSGAGETPKPDDGRFARNEHHVIATAQDALEVAAAQARAAGVTPYLLGNDLEGEASDTGWVHAVLAEEIARSGQLPFQPMSASSQLQTVESRQLYIKLAEILKQYPQPLSKPCVLLSGGETTVTVRGNGRGGRNAEFLLGLVARLQGANTIYALACDTDGIDGSEDNAGAIYTPQSGQQAQEQGLDAKAMLENNDGYGFFAALDELIITGPTRTNVNDFRAILIL